MSEIKYRSNVLNALVRGEKIGDFWNMHDHEGKIVAYEYDPKGDTSGSWHWPKGAHEPVAPLTIGTGVSPMIVGIDVDIDEIKHNPKTIEWIKRHIDKPVTHSLKETLELIRKAESADKFRKALEEINSSGHAVHPDTDLLKFAQHLMDIANSALYGDDSE